VKTAPKTGPKKGSKKGPKTTLPAGTCFTLRPLIRAKCRHLTGHGPDGKKKDDVFLPSESDSWCRHLGKAGFGGLYRGSQRVPGSYMNVLCLFQGSRKGDFRVSARWRPGVSPRSWQVQKSSRIVQKSSRIVHISGLAALLAPDGTFGWILRKGRFPGLKLVLAGWSGTGPGTDLGWSWQGLGWIWDGQPGMVRDWSQGWENTQSLATNLPGICWLV